MSALAQERRLHLAGALWMTVGSLIVFTSVVLMNKYAETRKDKDGAQQVSFAVEKRPPPPPQASLRQPPPPKPRSAPPPLSPLAGLGSGISGIDLGLPAFNFDDLGKLGDSLLGEGRDVVMTDDSVDSAPRPAQQAPMEYPSAAKARGITGYVVLNLLINASGQVEKVKVLESVPSGMFDEAAAAGVRNWRFEPARYQGQSVRVWAKQKIRFDLG